MNDAFLVSSSAGQIRGRLLLAFLCAMTVFGEPAAAVDLPAACAAGLCGAAGPTGFVSQGAATLLLGTHTATITQTTPSALLNWQSFNVSSDASVTFVQPSSSSIALNRIFQQDASRIFGTLNANGTVYLLNQNGFLFGKTAVVNVGGLLASSLNISPDALALGIGNSSSNGAAAFQPYTNASGQSLVSGNITVEHGATIDANGGQVMLFAPNVENAGKISTPDGQTIIAAGQRVFLAVSTDPNVRGLLVEVGNGGTATNDGAASTAGGMGEIVANRGNVTIAGLAVNQNGRVSATTTTRVNGSLLLQARDTGAATLSLPGRLQYDRTGTVTFGTSSVTEVSLEGSSTDTAVDATAQPKSVIQASGSTILVDSQARITATSGTVAMTATPANPSVLTSTPDASRIYVAPDAVIDVSGATVALPVEQNSLAVQLRGSELADNPSQRDGALRGLTVYVDIRNYGVDANGRAWVGTPLADLTGDVGTIRRDVFERNLTGGTVKMTSTGSVIVDAGATINISGGQIDWQSGYVKTTTLLGANGVAYNIGTADPNRAYVGTLDSISVSDPHWGTAVTAASFGRDPRGTYTPGYVEGKDAGALTIVAPGVILDGSVTGSATTGPLQRLVPTAIPAGSLYRPANETPLGGLLTLGSAQGVSDPTVSEVIADLAIEAGQVLPTLTNASGAAFDPLHDVLPAGFTSVLRPDLVSSGGLTRLALYAEGTVTLPYGVALRPGAGSSVTIDAGQIHFGGTIEAPGGSVTLAAIPTPSFNSDAGLPFPGLYTGSHAYISTSGEWINDSPTVTASPTDPLFISGGKVTLSASQGSMVLPAGFTVDVSGGAQLTAAGAIVAGKGGAIVINDNPGPKAGQTGLETQFAPTLYGYAISSGGAVTIALPAECLSGVACANPNAVAISPAFLSSNGFAALTLSSTTTGFEVLGDVDVHVEQVNLALTANALTAASANSLRGLATPKLLPDYVRAPASLTLVSTMPFDPTQPHSDLLVAAGASITTDAQGSITLRSDARILEDGSLVAPGGQITLDLVNGPNTLGLRSDQAIWLGSGAVLDVSGTVIYTPSAQGLDLGRVLAGGSVSLLAESGYLVALSGATIDARGTDGLLDIRNSSSSAAYTRTDIASAGGAITLFAAEGIQFDATFHANGGTGSTSTLVAAPGGSLTVTVNGDLGTGAARSTTSYPSNPRILTITAANDPGTIVEGSAIPLALNGLGRIGAPLITAGGFDQLRFEAGNLLANPGAFPTTVATGSVAFESGVTLAPRVSLVVNSPDVQGLGSGVVVLAAPYVALGSTDLQTQSINNTPAAGAALLEVQAATLDLVGAFTLSGFAAEHLVSAGDIRTVGVQLGGTTPYVGKLLSAGALDLVAQQIYPTSLSAYTIALPGAGDLGHLSIGSAPGTAGLAYSANGALTLQAETIDDAGVVRAPFGSVTLSGATVNLLAGSLTSVSGAGLDVLYGETQGGLDWIYPLNSLVTQVYGTGAGSVLPPQKRLNVSGGTVNIASGAIVDVSGGGDLSAFEFTAGVGGTRDVTSNLVSPNLYAVIPGVQMAAAPIDPLTSQGFGLAAGSRVYLAGGNGLAAGYYTLLPARYALLPGAFLVKPVGGYTDLSPTTPLTQFDGSVIMAGFRASGYAALGDTRSSGFDVQPGSYAYKQAGYTLTSANTFFQTQAQAAGVAAPRVPADAGSLAINATLAATLDGTLRSSHPATGSRGALVDLSSANIYIGRDPSAAPTGYVTFDPTQLDALGAESLLIGGVRTPTKTGSTLAVGAANVIVGDGATLSGQEILLAGRSSVQLSTGAAVEASGAIVLPEAPMAVTAGTALIRASTGVQQDFTLIGTGGAGQVLVDTGATLAATGSIGFSSGGVLSFKGALNASGASVRLNSTQIGIGPVPTGFVGFALTPELIAGLGSANLELATPNVVQFFGTSTLTLDRLALLAPGLVAATPGATLTVDAPLVSLGGPAIGGTTVSAGSGSVTLNVDTLSLVGGSFGVDGVGSTTVDAARAVVATADGTFATSGSLSITTPAVVTSGAFDMTLAASGSLAIANRAAGANLAAVAPAAGGRYTLTGSSVGIDTAVLLPGGQVIAQSSAGDVALGSHANLDVSGFSQAFGTQVVSAPGGLVSLSASGGNVAIDPMAVVDVSAGHGSGTGGALVLVAPDGGVALAGTLRGAGGAGAAGAALSVDAQSFSMSALLDLNATGGFTGAVTVRERGNGDLIVGAGQTLRAADVSLTADQGAVSVTGTIDASSATGQTVTLAASGDVRVDGTIRADATASSARGGTINLESANGGIYLDSGAHLSVGGVGGAATGSVLFRLPRSAVESVLGAGAGQLVLAGGIAGAHRVAVEGYQAYDSNGVIDDSVVLADPSNPIYADAAAFTANAQAIAAALGKGSDPTFEVLPGIELRTPGDLHVASTWDLSTWRFGPTGATPGVLTLRAGGGLYVDQSLSDGFAGTDPFSGFTLLQGFGASWSYRLAAGADLSSSQPLAVATLANLGATAGNLVVAPGLPSDRNGVNGPTYIRTGTGSIDIAAGRDLVLASQASVIYTAGVGSPDGLPLYDYDSGFQGNPYPTGGGSIRISAGRDVIGAPSNQLFNDWLWRAGSNSTSQVGYNPAAWLVSYGNFEQGVGAFGGGDVSIVASRNIVDLGANVTTTGVPIGDGTQAGTTTQIWGDGLLSVVAGGDIRGGKFLGMADGASLVAGGQLTTGSATARTVALNPILALGGDTFSTLSRRTSTIEMVLNPTLLPRSLLQARRRGRAGGVLQHLHRPEPRRHQLRGRRRRARQPLRSLGTVGLQSREHGLPGLLRRLWADTFRVRAEPAGFVAVRERPRAVELRLVAVRTWHARLECRELRPARDADRSWRGAHPAIGR